GVSARAVKARGCCLDPGAYSGDAVVLASHAPARGVHLVGSVPLASSEVVLRTVAREIGDRLRRVPDGETGPRSDWIVWQLSLFTSQPAIEIAPPDPRGWRPLPRVRLAAEGDVDRVRFDALGYADAAVASYRTFARLKRDGSIPI